MAKELQGKLYSDAVCVLEPQFPSAIVAPETALSDIFVAHELENMKTNVDSSEVPAKTSRVGLSSPSTKTSSCVPSP